MRRMMIRMTSAALGVALFCSAPVAIGSQEPENAPPKIVNVTVTTAPESRPPILWPLYGTFAMLEAYDGYSTIRGVGNGASESNPLVVGLSQRPALFWTLKAATVAATTYSAERLWRRHHKKGAIAIMIIANGAMAAVAVNNA